jgi:glycosyltransferase involved in cell wall biosynthesis
MSGVGSAHGDRFRVRWPRGQAVIVGFESHNYGAARNTYAPIAGVEFRKVRRLPVERIAPAARRGYGTAFVPLGPSRCDVVHLWNRVGVGRAPWGASFESHYPYLDSTKHPDALRRLRRLARDARFLVGISEWAALQVRLDCPELADRLHVIPPAQQIVERTKPYPALDGPLRLIFVGVTFFGKGGEAVLRCVEQVGDELDLQLTVISPVAGNDYGGTPPDDVDVGDIRRRLQSNRRITWHSRLDNAQVLDLMQDHHIGVLPTFADTYGYVALELQALGIPSIVSNVQALPEFTSDETGWRVNVELDDRGVWVGRQRGAELRRTAYHDAVELVTRQLARLLRDLRGSPSDISDRAETSRSALFRRIADADRGVSLLRIYDSVACE